MRKSQKPIAILGGGITGLTAAHELEKLGQRDFGENYLDEAREKIIQINNPNIVWHYIVTYGLSVFVNF